MAISLVQTKQNNFSTPTTSIGTTFTSNVVAGNKVIVFVHDSSNITFTITDSQGNTYSAAGTASYLWNGANVTGIYYATISSSGSLTVTVTVSSGSNCSIIIREYSGLAVGVDQATQANGSNSVPSSGATGTTTQADELVVSLVGMAVSNTAQSAGSGYGNLVTEATQANASLAVEDKIVSTTGTQTGVFGVSHFFNWGCMVATFKGASSGADAPQKFIYNNPRTGPRAMRNKWHARQVSVSPVTYSTKTQGLTGAVSFTGAHSAKNVFTKLLTGALSFTGVFAKQLTKAFTAVLSLTGGQTGYATPTLVQTGTINTGTDAASNNLTFPSNVTPGNAIIVSVVEAGNGTISGVSDAQGSFTQIGSALTFSGVTKQASFYALNRTGGTNSLTVSVGGITGSGLYVIAQEWSGLSTYEGQAQQQQSTVTSITSGNYTTTGAPDQLFALFGTGVSLSGTTGSWTGLAGVNNTSYIAYQTANSTGSYAATGTLSSTASADSQIAAFRIATITVPALRLYISKLMSAGLSFTGVFKKAMYKVLAGVVSFSGAILTGGHFNYIVSLVAASLGFSGNITKRTSDNQSASVSFTGNTTKRTAKTPFTAGLSFSGAFQGLKRAVQNLTGSLSFSGNFRKLPNKALTAAVSFVGSQTKAIAKAMAGVLSFTGNFNRGGIFFRSVSANLSFSGAFAKRQGKNFTGVLSFTGNFKYGSQFFRNMTGNLSFTGVTNLPKAIFKRMTAGLSFVGAVRKALAKTTFTGSLSFAGNLFKRAGKRLTGGVSFTGAWSKSSVLFKNFTASLGFTGTFRKDMYKRFTAGLSFTGAFKKARFVLFTAVLSFTSGGRNLIKTSFSGSLSFVGTFIGFIKSKLQSIGIIVSSTTTGVKSSSSTNVVIDQTNDTIRTVESEGNTSTATSSTRQTTVSSETNKTEVGK